MATEFSKRICTNDASRLPAQTAKARGMSLVEQPSVAVSRKVHLYKVLVNVSSRYGVADYGKGQRGAGAQGACRLYDNENYKDRTATLTAGQHYPKLDDFNRGSATERA
jgi:hypothetical protein